MKKIFAAIITAFLMSAGLVATASLPAAAAPCSYPDTCFATETNAVGLNTRGPGKAGVYVKVSSFGAGDPARQGRLTFTFVKENGNSVEFTRNYTRAKPYNFRLLPRGRYTVIVSFVPDDGSQFEGSSDTTKVKVKGGRRG